ncbi:hypothetical protein JAB9_08720 [Janthinobacterium sp. HH107]|nr:hypothetical protein JAB9_08720 [Janthinobacterium sp. HH107]
MRSGAWPGAAPAVSGAAGGAEVAGIAAVAGARVPKPPTASMQWRNSSARTGLVRQYSTPSAVTWRSSAEASIELSMMIFSAAMRASPLIARTSSAPSMTGMRMSMIARSNGRPLRSAPCSRSSASAPSAALAAAICHSIACCSRILRLVAWSSTISTFKASSDTRGGGAGGASSGATSPTTTVTAKLEPCPATDWSTMLPPIISASCLMMARPSPVPPYLREVVLSAWRNGWKTAAAASGAMPMPVSRTSRRIRPAAGQLTSTEISPRSVNLVALLSRLVRIWRRRTGSPRTCCGTSEAMRQVNSMTLRWMPLANSATTSSITWRRSKGMCSSTSLPASILEKSRMSSMMLSRLSPERCTVCTKRCCLGLSSVRCSNSVMPSTPFIGVRISWLILARNSDLARLAASASALACVSARSRCSTCSSMPLKPVISCPSSSLPCCATRTDRALPSRICAMA